MASLNRILLAALFSCVASSSFAQSSGLIPGGTVLGNDTASEALASPSSAPVLGVPGSVAGQLGIAGSASGTATIKAQSAAGTPTLTLPNVSGTFAVGASSPLALNTTSGLLSITGLAGAVLAGSPPSIHDHASSRRSWVVSWHFGICWCHEWYRDHYRSGSCWKSDADTSEYIWHVG
jgi:hypothetical protein